MRGRGIDWRLIGVIAVVAVMAGSQRLPPPVVALVLGGAGGYLLLQGWRVWSGGGGGRGRVVYWRGQRIEVDRARSRGLPSLRGIGPAAVYLGLGALLALAAVAVVLRQLGL